MIYREITNDVTIEVEGTTVEILNYLTTRSLLNEEGSGENSDWIEYNGKFFEMPNGNFLVQVQSRNGEMSVDFACNFDWNQVKSDNDIVRYKVLE